MQNLVRPVLVPSNVISNESSQHLKWIPNCIQSEKPGVSSITRAVEISTEESLQPPNRVEFTRILIFVVQLISQQGQPDRYGWNRAAFTESMAPNLAGFTGLRGLYSAANLAAGVTKFPESAIETPMR